jgi:pyruvate dehydrogenase complex dehydrogenase (E1) component
MKRREYEQLKRQFKAERDAKVAAAEADYQRDVDALERIWARTGGKQESAPQIEPSIPAIQPEIQSHRPVRTRRLGIRKAIREAISALGTDQFNTDSIIEKVKVAHPDVKRQTVTDALFRMAEGEDAELETVIPGKGRRQAVYRIRRRIQGTQPKTLENEAIRSSEELPM